MFENEIKAVGDAIQLPLKLLRLDIILSNYNKITRYYANEINFICSRKLSFIEHSFPCIIEFKVINRSYKYFDKLK